MSVNVSNAYKFFGGAEGGGGGLQPEDFHELVMTGGYSGGSVTRRYGVFEGLDMVVGNLFFTKHNQLFEAYNPLNEDNVSIELPGGANIYPTIQDAISDVDNLSVGDIFETNGFHTSGDGGAARYLVSDTGTANGMDTVQLAVGKLAVLQVGDWIIPEQLGYEQSYSRDDVVPYIQRAITIGCQHIHLRSSGNGAGYTWKSKLTVTSRGFKLTGEGDWGYPNKFTYIVFRPTDATVSAMIDMRARDVVLKDLDIEVTGDYVKSVDGITNTGYDSDENRFWEIDNVRFNSFDNCIKFAGGIKWQNSIKNCLFNSCNIGLQIYESSTFELIVENCLFVNCEQYDVLVNGNLFAALFDSCGFGSQGTAIGLTTNSDSYMYQNIKFEGCNFEQDDLSIQNAPALFIDCFPNQSHPYLRQNITLSHCHLTICKISYTEQDATNRFFRLAPKTNLLLIANQILGKDEPEHPDWVVYPKLLWNENYLPTLGLGGIIECGNNLCGNGNFEYPDQFLPFVTRSTQARSILSTGAQSGTDSAIADCNAFIPAHCGEFIIGRGSTFEGTTNMPTTSIFGFLYSVGVTEGPNKRVIQVMTASNSNIYTRIGRDTGGGWTWDAWKTITANIRIPKYTKLASYDTNISSTDNAALITEVGPFAILYYHDNGGNLRLLAKNMDMGDSHSITVSCGESVNEYGTISFGSRADLSAITFSASNGRHQDLRFIIDGVNFGELSIQWIQSATPGNSQLWYKG